MSRIVAIILTIIALSPQALSQQIVHGHCDYLIDSNNHYACILTFNVLWNPTDVLVINGTHLQGFTDADVHAAYIRASVMRYFNGEVMNKFFNLKVLDMNHHVFLHSIHPDAFNICGQLEQLNIRNVYLASLPSQMLGNCPNLRIFLIDDNRESLALPEDLFGGTSNLEVFTVSVGSMTAIPDHLLHNMTNLRVFNVQQNRIESLSPTMFTNMKNLESIDISSNNFSDQAAVINLLQSQLTLRRIIVSFNPFRMFNFNFFAQFPNLEELEVGGSHQMTGVSWFFASNTLAILRVFFIGDGIPENAFHGFPNLRILHLTGGLNPSIDVTFLHKDMFKMSTNLESLQIERLRLAPLDPQLFAAQANLRHLEMRACFIAELPDGIFVPLVNLGIGFINYALNLNSNLLQRLQLSAFSHHPSLRNVMFAGNRINEIQHGLFGRFSNSTIFAPFDGNACVDQTFSQINNLDDHPELHGCFENFEESLRSTTTAMTSTTDGCGREFRIIEIFFVMFVGLVGVLGL